MGKHKSGIPNQECYFTMGEKVTKGGKRYTIAEKPYWNGYTYMCVLHDLNGNFSGRFGQNYLSRIEPSPQEKAVIEQGAKLALFVKTNVRRFEGEGGQLSSIPYPTPEQCEGVIKGWLDAVYNYALKNATELITRDLNEPESRWGTLYQDGRELVFNSLGITTINPNHQPQTGPGTLHDLNQPTPEGLRVFSQVVANTRARTLYLMSLQPDVIRERLRSTTPDITEAQLDAALAYALTGESCEDQEALA